MDNNLLSHKEVSAPLCRQCGQCCRQGGPLLHLNDMPLVREGHICLSKLVTLRQGELAYNAIKQSLSPLKAEVIKIAGTGEQAYPWHCVFHINNVCALYPLRPAQCAALYCEDSTALMAMYEHNRANRKDILTSQGQGWLELAMAHEEECPINSLIEYAANYQQAQSEILQMINYDQAFRELCIEKAQIPSKALNVVLGRPISNLLSGFGLALQVSNHKPVILRVGKSHY